MRKFIIALALVTMTAAPSFAGSIATSTADRSVSVSGAGGLAGCAAGRVARGGGGGGGVGGRQGGRQGRGSREVTGLHQRDGGAGPSRAPRCFLGSARSTAPTAHARGNAAGRC